MLYFPSPLNLLFGLGKESFFDQVNDLDMANNQICCTSFYIKKKEMLYMLLEYFYIFLAMCITLLLGIKSKAQNIIALHQIIKLLYIYKN